MTNGRKTTLKERIDITKHCLTHNKNYVEVVRQYKVSYSQIISWVKKYELYGEDGLMDKRGRNKPESEMTALEKQNLRRRQHRKESKKKEIENAVAKKMLKIDAKNLRGHLHNKEKYQAIYDLHNVKSYPVSLLCQYAKVGRASYYQWLRQATK